MNREKLQGILGSNLAPAFTRAVQLTNDFFERVGTPNAPTREEARTLVYEVMSARVLMQLQGRAKEEFICKEMLDLVLLTEVALGRTP